MYCDLDFLLFEPGINGAHPQLVGSRCVKFYYYRCKDKAIMHHKSFSVITAL